MAEQTTEKPKRRTPDYAKIAKAIEAIGQILNGMDSNDAKAAWTAAKPK